MVVAKENNRNNFLVEYNKEGVMWYVCIDASAFRHDLGEMFKEAERGMKARMAAER